MSGILAVLDCNEVLSADFAVRLREYISFRNPSSSPYHKAGLFADAVNRIVAYKAPRYGDELGGRFRELLYPEVVRKKVFSLSCSDIFKASLGMKSLGYLFFKGLSEWLSDLMRAAVDRESLFDFVLKVHKQIGIQSGKDISEIIKSVECESGGIRFEQPVSAGIETVQAADYQIQAICPEPCMEIGAVESIITTYDGSDAGKYPMLEFPSRLKAVSGLAAAVLTLFFIFSPSTSKNLPIEKGAYTDVATVTERFQPPETAPLPIGVQLPGMPEPGGLVSPAGMEMRATAYDLSYESCGKMPWDPGYGITFSGTKATAGRTIAVDPEVIPIGSRVQITFPEKYSYMDGIYVAEDSGRLIKGRAVDIFFGEDKTGSRKINKKAMDFGVRKVYVKVLNLKDNS